MDHGTPKGFRSSQGDAIYFVWTKYQDSMVVVDRPTGILSFIHISPHWETPLLGDFIAQAGEPEGVALTIGRPITESTCDCATVSPDRFVPERDWARVGDTDEWDETWQPYLLTLFYPQQGIKISTYRFREDYPCICPQMPIDNRYFGTPYDPSAVLDKDEEIYPWSGFGRVDLDPARRISLD